MEYTFFELLWYFFIYSFAGWCAETAYASLKDRTFRNRGFLNGPFCPVYGVGMVLILTFFGSLRGHFILLTMGCAVVAALVEFFTGALMEKLFHCKWWDYSGFRGNLNGYVCFPFSCLWGVGAAFFLTFVQPFLEPVFEDDGTGLFPPLLVRIAAAVLLGLTLMDFAAVTGTIGSMRRGSESGRLQELGSDMQRLSERMGNGIAVRIRRRMEKAFPMLAKEGRNQLFVSHRAERIQSRVFAEGCSFYKLVWLFFIGAFLGDVTETIFCRLTAGVWMSRSSVVYGPFSIVWGIGVVVLTMMLHRYRDRSDRYIFLFGTVVGGAYEYVCSVFTELVFGTVFWDYSKIPFNLGGRINLLYCFFWGLAAVIWIKNIYPFLAGRIEKIPMKPGKLLGWLFIAFMVVNVTISALALYRYSERAAGREAAGVLEEVLDERFPDERMERIYPNAIIK